MFRLYSHRPDSTTFPTPFSSSSESFRRFPGLTIFTLVQKLFDFMFKLNIGVNQDFPPGMGIPFLSCKIPWS